MARLWAAHDRAARDLLPAFRGREIDKTDGMLLMFDAAEDAVGYALAYQHALSTLVPQLTARAGLHVGLVTLRENSPSDVAMGAKPLDVEGVAKATAARVMSIAMGGQILLSADAQQSFERRSRFRLQSHGHWRLKGLDEPIELFEVGDDGACFLRRLMVRRPTGSSGGMASGHLCARSGTACQPRTTPSSDAPTHWTRCPGSSGRVCASCRYSASAAQARRGW